MARYSIAIRTLGTAGEKFRKELESIKTQTVQPEKIVVYLAEGYQRPPFTVWGEEYVTVPKGMMRQRILKYDEIESEYILLLDDDIQLSADVCSKMVDYMEAGQLDCLGVDIYESYKKSAFKKLKLGLMTFVFPFRSKKWAFKIRNNGASAYNGNPEKELYMSQSSAGGAVMIRKQSFLNLRMEDELWLDDLNYSFGEDQLMFYKFYRNSYKLSVLFHSGCVHLDAGSSQEKTNHNKHKKLFSIIESSVPLWYRTIYASSRRGILGKTCVVLSFVFKNAFLLSVRSVQSVIKWDFNYARQYWKGLREGMKVARSDWFRKLPPYKLDV